MKVYKKMVRPYSLEGACQGMTSWNTPLANWMNEEEKTKSLEKEMEQKCKEHDRMSTLVWEEKYEFVGVFGTFHLKDDRLTIYSSRRLGRESMNWISTDDQLPPKGAWVLVTKEDSNKPFEVMAYQGMRIGKRDDGDGWKEYEFPCWTSGYGDVQSHHPKYWAKLPMEIKE